MNLKDDFYKKLDWNKPRYNGKNPIKMKQFLSFLKDVELEISKDHLGYCAGWTQRINKNLNLIITGAKCAGYEWYADVQYGKNLHNPYNNYVNVFFLFDIMTEEGKTFFLNYYKEDIYKILKDNKVKRDKLKKELEEQQSFVEELEQEIDNYFKNVSDEQLAADLEAADFEFYNQIED